MSKHKKSRRLTTESTKELSEIDRSQTKHAIIGIKKDFDRKDKIEVFKTETTSEMKRRRFDDAMSKTKFKRFQDEYQAENKFVETGEKINPNKAFKGNIIDYKERKKYAKGINCSPCTIKAMSRLRVQLATMKKKKSISDDIMDRFEHFLERKPKTKGVSGVFDPSGMRILDANIPSDSMRLQNLFGNKNSLIGFNSITDTRLGPAKDPNLIRKQLREIESRGGTPALGFDEGSLEAVDVATGTKDEHVLAKLLPHQKSTGILDPKNKFRIVQNPNFSLTWK